MVARFAVLFACLAAPVAVILAADHRETATPAPAKPYGAERPAFAQLSAASCAAAACHGSGQVGRKGSEQTTWAADAVGTVPSDPHARAYRVLFTQESERMVKAAGGPAAHKNALCLKCHAVDGVTPGDATSEGVGCGACHGPADGWLAAHVQPGWAAVPNRERWEKYGFAPTKNLVARTLACAGCHVGAADREVNHDLIAAGHPRLAFEATRFHFAPDYRKHWTEKTPQPDFEVRAWVVGQAAGLRAAAEVLGVRARRATDRKAAWPEFAGLSCYACHQRIDPAGPRRDATAGRRVGTAGWEVWSNAAFDTAKRLAPEAFPGLAAPELPALAALRAAMNEPSPDPKAVAGHAAKVVVELDEWLAAVQAAEDRGPSAAADAPRKIAHELARTALTPDRTKLADPDWDALAANYLGCAAMYHAAGGRKAAPGWTAAVRELGDTLAFPPGYTSPKGFDATKRDAVRARFAELFDATAEPGGKR